VKEIVAAGPTWIEKHYRTKISAVNKQDQEYLRAEQEIYSTPPQRSNANDKPFQDKCYGSIYRMKQMP